MNDDLINVSIFSKEEYSHLNMRAIYILFILSIIIFNGCATVEVAKEVTKATESVKTTIQKITNNQDNIEKTENYKKEKEEIVIERKKGVITAIKQNKIATIKLLGKNLNQLIQEFGNPVLIRNDGNTRTIRFDTSSCRLFVYFNLTANKSGAKYYEIRNTKGVLLNKKENIKKCFQEITKI